MKPVSLLARIRVATPCRADWNEMTGDERVRHCAHCDKDVFNLSDLSREQAERLIIERRGDLCARYYQRQDGTILLADCSVGVRQKRTTRVLAAGAAALLAGTGGAGAFLKLSHGTAAAPAASIDDDPLMGRMAVVQPEPPPPPPDIHEIKGQMIERPATPPPESEMIQGDISIDPGPPIENAESIEAVRREQEQRLESLHPEQSTREQAHAVLQPAADNTR